MIDGFARTEVLDKEVLDRAEVTSRFVLSEDLSHLQPARSFLAGSQSRKNISPFKNHELAWYLPRIRQQAELIAARIVRQAGGASTLQCYRTGLSTTRDGCDCVQSTLNQAPFNNLAEIELLTGCLLAHDFS